MLIDSAGYGGKCTCGRCHEMQTKLAVAEAGCMEKFDAYLEKYQLTGFRTVIYDQNTYHAAGLTRPRADQEIILDPENLHANEKSVAKVMAQLSDKTRVLIAVGSGTVHDVTRYCAWRKGLPFVSCPTAASVDGFCSSVAAMTWEGVKRTLTAVPPVLVFADLNVITKAPLFLARSGFGDMIGKFIALADWKISHILTGEFYCERIAEMTEKATQAVLESAEGIASGDPSAFEKLTYGLLLSGLAMQLTGNSRPASGAEHHISHIIEMEPENLEIHSDALHGEKVGVGTLIAAAEYHRLARVSGWKDYPTITEEEIHAVFGNRLSRQIAAENEKNAAAGVTGDCIRAHWEEIQAQIAKIPDAEELARLYQRLGVMNSLSDLGIPEKKRAVLLDTSPMVRNRLTLMRLRRCLK